jgi:hypothetical protein
LTGASGSQQQNYQRKSWLIDLSSNHCWCLAYLPVGE